MILVVRLSEKEYSMLRLISTILLSLAGTTLVLADSAATVSPLPSEEFEQLIENRIVPIDTATKTAILAISSEDAPKKVIDVSKLLRDGASTVSLSDFAHVLEDDESHAIALRVLDHDDPVIRFVANIVLTIGGDANSAANIHKLFHNESLVLTDKQIIRTWCDQVGICATHDAKKILELLIESFSDEPKFKKGETPPDFDFTTTTGKNFSSPGLRGKIIVLHFWATCCGPCIGQMPSHISTLAEYDQDKVEVVFVSLDRDEKAFETFIQNRKIPFNNVRDGFGQKEELSRIFRVNSIPYDVILDADGKLASYSIDDVSEILATSRKR